MSREPRAPLSLLIDDFCGQRKEKEKKDGRGRGRGIPPRVKTLRPISMKDSHDTESLFSSFSRAGIEIFVGQETGSGSSSRELASYAGSMFLFTV